MSYIPVCFQPTSIKTRTTTFRSQVETETQIKELPTTADNQFIIVCEITSDGLEKIISGKNTAPFRSDFFPLLKVAVLRVVGHGVEAYRLPV